MTSLALLTWIVLGIVLQLALFLGILFARHWRGYQSLLQQGDDLAIGTPGSAPDRSAAPAVGPWAGFRPFRVERKVIEDARQTVCSFYLVPENGQPLPAFQPGQFLTFKLVVPDSDGGSETLVRCYSLSHAPTPDHYRISVKRIRANDDKSAFPGRASNFLHDFVGIGDVIEARSPAGHFHLDRGDAPVVLIAGGIGITPMISMIDWSLTERPEREVWLFYGARNGRELVMQRHLQSLAAAHPKFHLRICLSAPLPGDLDAPNCRRGRVDLNALRLQLPLKPYHFHLCGPTAMLESLVPALDQWGVPAARIHYEAFGPASIARPKPSPEPIDMPGPADGAATDTSATDGSTNDKALVTFARSGKTVAWQRGNGSLLELAEASGISIPSGCRAGGCGTCQTTIRSGEVRYRQSPDYDPEPGTCLMCVCTPTTSVTLEA